ncbi:MAG: SDR family oxidoreductase [Lentisphaerae bacterium]|nr:SDR family oxidoreductase [Lentisphaerota bacterium]
MPDSSRQFPRVAVTGGAGYVGSVLVPELLARGHTVKVIDTFAYGRYTLDAATASPRYHAHEMDIRDGARVREALRGVDAVIHLAAVANDQSYDLDPDHGRAVNLDAFAPLVQAAIDGGARRFIYASSSSVYGSTDEDATEDFPTAPLTGYAASKLGCEQYLLDQTGRLEGVIVRPAALCGCSPRMRFDLTINILTLNALVNRVIRVFGGKQYRSHLHVRDMAAAYIGLLDADSAAVDGEIFNASDENCTVADAARRVAAVLATRGVTIDLVPHVDARSYRISAAKLARTLGFTPSRHLEDAVREVEQAWEAGTYDQPLTNPLYANERFTAQRLTSPQPRT